MSYLRTLPVLAGILLAGSVLTSCGSLTGNDHMTTGSVENDYRARHPITLSEAEHTLDVPVASGDLRLSLGVRDSIRGFGSAYQGNSSGVVQIVLPVGSVNSAAAMAAKREIRAILQQSGVSPRQIIETSYQASNPEQSAPIRLSYVAITAATDQCGNWPDDLIQNSVKNENWHNFGCASQQNLAAQIANPMDLVAPRGMSPIDAERRSTVITKWRQGTTTVSQ